MTTTLSHPVLRGHPTHPANAGRPRLRTTPGSFWVLAAVVTVLNMIGLVMVMSASSVVSVHESGAPWSYVGRQVMWTTFGVVALLATLAISIDFWRRHARLWLTLTMFGLVVVLIPGVGIKVNGARRWLGAGPVQIQPSEFAKFALLLFVADLLARRAEHVDDWRWTLAPVVAYLSVVAGLIMLQPNLGTTIIIATMVLVMLLASGVRLVPLGLTTLAGALIASAFVAFTPFRRERFLRFLNPMGDPLGSGLQNVQSLVGLANGGVLGRGLGQSTVKWGYLPYAWTDFIFAVIGEEFGLVGAMFVVLLYLVLAAVGALVASQARDRFAMLVAVGITAWLTVQALMNIGAVLSIMPITGVPLPFVSFGGSSLIVNLAAMGMLLNIARHPVEPARARTRRRRGAATR